VLAVRKDFFEYVQFVFQIKQIVRNKQIGVFLELESGFGRQSEAYATRRRGPHRHMPIADRKAPSPIEKHLPMFFAQRERTVISKAWRLCVCDGVGSRACGNGFPEKFSLIAEGNQPTGMLLLVGATQVSEVSKFRKAFNFSSKSEEGAVLAISDFCVPFKSTRKQPVANN